MTWLCHSSKTNCSGIANALDCFAFFNIAACQAVTTLLYSSHYSGLPPWGHVSFYYGFSDVLLFLNETRGGSGKTDFKYFSRDTLHCTALSVQCAVQNCALHTAHCTEESWKKCFCFEEGERMQKEVYLVLFLCLTHCTTRYLAPK